MQHMCLPACTSTPLTCNAKAGASAPTKQHHTSTPPPTASGNHISPNSHHPNTSPNLDHTGTPLNPQYTSTPPPTASGKHISPNSHHPNTSPNLNHTSKPSSLRQARTPPPTRIIHTPQPTSYTSHDPTRIIYIPRPNPHHIHHMPQPTKSHKHILQPNPASTPGPNHDVANARTLKHCLLEGDASGK